MFIKIIHETYNENLSYRKNNKFRYKSYTSIYYYLLLCITLYSH